VLESAEGAITTGIRVENLDHLGIVAGLIDEMGPVELLNKRLGIDPREKVSTGVVVKAMLLNGLGFVSAPCIDLRHSSKAKRPSSFRHGDKARTIERRPLRQSAR
jgi:hypothetical protein